MNSTPVIPIFPLAIVVYPGQTVPLHIFEERYKAMVIDCSPGRSDGPFSPFGISMQLGGEVEPVGCSVVVSDITERYADGSFDIIARAERRYTTVRTFDDRPYLTGEVEYFEDTENPAVEPGLRQEVEARLAELVDLASKEAGVADEPGDAPDSSDAGDAFTMAARVGLGLKQKQRILEARSERQRLEQLASYLDEALPTYRERVHRKHHAKSNGRSVDP